MPRSPGQGEPLSGCSGTHRRAGTVPAGSPCSAARSCFQLGMLQPEQEPGGRLWSAPAQRPGQEGREPEERGRAGGKAGQQ